ncbi:MAG TPA: hypothetical protein VF414_14500 [Thermoanaerobaculia bacterium]
MAMTFLAAGTGCLSAQDSKQPPAAVEEPAAPVSEDHAPAQEPEPAPVATETGDDTAITAEDTAPDWQSELDGIADLLIDGKPLEARGKADQLLQVENLPESVASRARELRDKADERLAAAPPAGSEPRPKIEITGKEESGKKSEKPEATSKESSFKVRMAAVGSGFSQGVTGLLRISDTGISFTPQEKGGESWAIRWPNLVEAKNDTGLWDAPHPLVLTERGGRKRYVARLDSKGTYLPGAPLLSAIAEGRRKQKPPQPKTAEPKEGQ